MKLVLETSPGEIVIEVFETRAPLTVAYVLGLVDEGVYDGSWIYRTTTLGVADGPRLIQGGPLARALASSIPGTGPAQRRPPPLLAEFETTAQSGLSHRRGTVSLARDLIDTGSAIPDFFICLGDFPQLDLGGRSEPDERGFPAFGEIAAGLDLVERIAAGEARGTTPLPMLEGQILTEPTPILRVARG